LYVLIGKDVAYTFDIGKEIVLFLRLFLLEARLDQPRTNDCFEVEIERLLQHTEHLNV
jgi:hypothetical protein